MSSNLETMIISGLIHSEDFRRKALPHIKAEYFEDANHKTVFKHIDSYVSEYNSVPTDAALRIELENNKSLSEDMFQGSVDLTGKLYSESAQTAVQKSSLDWMLERTEKHCLDRSVYNAIMKSIDVIDGSNKKLSKDGLPDMLQKALSVSFDSEVGHDYLEDFESRFDYYHLKEDKIPTPLSVLNDLTRGGYPRKTLNCIIAPTGVGKTHIMTYFTSQYLLQGRDVLYISLEMAEERIAERIDTALLDVTSEDLKKYPKQTFDKKIQGVKNKTTGKLVIKEFPPGSLNANGIRFLLDELQQKKGFKPEIIVLDYINIAASYRNKDFGNSYGMVKNIAEEMRGLAVERELMLLTASQTNRSGQGAADFDLTEVSESHGLSMTADHMIGAIVTEELEEMNHMRIKILKNRYGGKSPSSFVIGMDREKMTLFDIDVTETTVADTKPKFDTANVAQIQPQQPKKSKLDGFTI